MDEHARCAQCRNPIRGRQTEVRHAAAGLTFHLDCWTDLHLHVQQDYALQVRNDGLPGLLGPYRRNARRTWLPERAEPEAVA